MKRQIASWIATCGPVGYLKKAPGTFGSLVGVVLVLITGNNISLFITLSICMFVVAVWSSGEVARSLNSHDPQTVVIDEVCGILVTFFMVPIHWKSVALGFALFRIFDILKPFPIRQIEKLPIGWGVMTDDVVAGLYANALLQFYCWHYLK